MFTRRLLEVALALAAGLVPMPSAAQEPPPAQPEERPTGLPGRITWRFNFDAAWGSFGFANSLYNNPKEEVVERLSDQWFEGMVKPALSGTFRLANASEVYGRISAVGERTYGAAPRFIGGDVSSFGAEDLAIGWRSGTAVGGGENVLDFVIGRAQYRLGHGLLLFDGAAEGGTRGGYWTNARKAFELAAIGRFSPGPHTVEGFYLDKDDLPEHDTGTRLFGANYEWSPSEHSTIGATYLSFLADAAIEPQRDGLDVFNVRAYTAPLPAVRGLSFEAEYASERNGDALDSNAWTLQAAYEFSDAAWSPTFSYRYAFFQGDDPDTAANEAFDPLLPGFYDWGSWWQGEIAGEYAFANSNLISHMIRAHVAPNDAVSGGLMLFDFTLDQPTTFAPGVTASDLAFEADVYVDWQINDNFMASFVAAFANPRAAVQQAFDRTKNFAYGMIYIGYSY
jgi:hypothetical protein